MSDSFQKNLVALRKSKGISQKDFAQMLNIPVTTLSGYETIGRQPKFETLIKMAEILNISVDKLIGCDIEQKLNLSDRQEIVESSRFRLVGDMLVVNLPSDPQKKAQAIMAMQTAGDFLHCIWQLEMGSVPTQDKTRRVLLKFVDAEKNE